MLNMCRSISIYDIILLYLWVVNILRNELILMPLIFYIENLNGEIMTHI